MKYLDLTREDLISSLILIDRLSYIHLNWNNCHRLCAVSLLLTIKMMHDSVYSNTYYAKVMGVSLSELNILEIEFLRQINWRVWVRDSGGEPRFPPPPLLPDV